MSTQFNARVLQVIATTLLRRGKGNDEDDPVRIITQYWTPEGELLAEVDPCHHLVWARWMRIALMDPPKGESDEWYRGWFEAREALEEAMKESHP